MERNIQAKNETMIITLMMMAVILHVILSLSGHVLEEMKIIRIHVKNVQMDLVQMKTRVNELLFEEMVTKEL